MTLFKYAILPAAFSFLTGCATATKPMLVAPAATGYSAPQTLSGNRVLVITPRVVYRDVNTEQVISGADQPLSQTISRSIASYAQSPLARNQLEITHADDFLETPTGRELEHLLLGLSEESGVLLRPRSQRRAQLLSQLQTLKTAGGVDAILIHAIDVRMGSSATYDYVQSGRMTASTNNTDLRAGLIETSTGKLIWDREIYDRDKLGLHNLDKLLDLLYSDFSVEVHAS